MNYNQKATTLSQLTPRYNRLAEIYRNWSPARQAELDQVKAEIESLENQYQTLNSVKDTQQ